ncbi:hypothetical protein M0805_008293 [Coniferiporia weirii]|nr:hypothetical protein M0805_008293 [Coniferiporia weirii]
MDAGAQGVVLRVLYTVNTSPQYILAKAPEKIALVSADVASGSNSLPRHGRALIKTCALAICRSSPELRPDISKDFSVYVLDPLEDLLSKGRHGQSGGVAVGMGLLSNIISPYTADSSMVTGTVIACGEGDVALEVVISLRQVAPSVIAVDEGQSSQSEETSSQFPSGRYPACRSSAASSKRSKQRMDQPFLATHPLPSFDARLFGSYAQQPIYDPQGLGSGNTVNNRYYVRRPNPTHSTRAHKLPTPYIGPPKRKYDQTRSRGVTSDPDLCRDAPGGSLNSIPVADFDSELDKCAEPSSSQEPVVSSDANTPVPPLSQQSNQSASNELNDLPETAAILAALSAVSSKPSEGGTAPNPQDNSSPNPDLVAFLRAYLSALESQQSEESSSKAPSSTPSGSASVPRSADAQTTVMLPAPQAEICGPVAGPSPQVETQIKTSNKENWKPPRPQQSSKDQASGSSSTSPLGLGRFNSRLSNGQQPESLKPSESQSGVNDTSIAANIVTQSNDNSRKRKLSDVAQDNASSQTKGRSSTVLRRSATVEDLSGIRVNTGWGGLRLRADGSFSGGHPLKTPATSNDRASTKLSQPVFFRSTGSGTTVTSARKAPYVTPDWARGVPPPIPPLRPEAAIETSTSKGRKCNKSKGLRRLGERRSVGRATDGVDASGALSESSKPVSRACSSQEKPASPRSPRTSPKRTPPGMLPIFAQSSPLAKASLSTFFQAFQTSPCRSIAERKNLLSTPRRSTVNTSPGGSAKHLSLFTPSPITSLGGGFKPRALFEGGDPPPSPTPSRRKLPSTSISEFPQQSGSPGTRPQTQDQNEDDDPPSSLPIASSDDMTDESARLPEQGISSDSTVMNLSRVHDWSSLDLPPSSPPPPSSPSIIPLERDDLPCSDIPSSDTSEGGTPSATTDTDTQPSPSEGLESRTGPEVGNLDFQDDLDFSKMAELFPDPTFSDFDLLMTGQDGSAADAAIDALRNGLGQEDLSEAWSLLDDVLNPAAMVNDATLDSQVDSWLGGPVQDFGLNELIGENNTVDSIDAALRDADYVSQAAMNFEELLKGCLV